MKNVLHTNPCGENLIFELCCMLTRDGGGVFCALGGVYSESGSRMGEGKQRCRKGPWYQVTEGVQKGHFRIPAGMVLRGGRRQSCVSLHMSQRSIFSSSKGFDTPGTVYHQKGG